MEKIFSKYLNEFSVVLLAAYVFILENKTTSDFTDSVQIPSFQVTKFRIEETSPFQIMRVNLN